MPLGGSREDLRNKLSCILTGFQDLGTIFQAIHLERLDAESSLAGEMFFISPFLHGGRRLIKIEFAGYLVFEDELA